MVCHHLVKFGYHKDSASGDIMTFVCNVTLQDHVINVFYDFILKNPS